MSTTTHPPTLIDAPVSTGIPDGEARTTPSATPHPLIAPARRAIWALPVWGLLLTLSTLTHQPSYDSDFRGYAEYVTTGQFLASHLVASILGAALGIIGVVSLVVLLADTRVIRGAFWGLSAFTVGQVLTTSVFGVAAFFQPAIGEAFLAGDESVARSVNESVYGPALFATAGTGLVLWTLGLVQLGRALRRVGTVPRWTGVALLVGAPAFAIAGLPFESLQPIAGVVLTVAAFTVARRVGPIR